MGSFRSQPDLTKHTKKASGPSFEYAVTHMCGNKTLMQVGGFTCRMRTSPNHSLLTRKTHSLLSSMVMAVFTLSFRS